MPRVKILDRDFESLLQLYRERSITKAARKLGMQQPGLSKALMRLEQQAGRKLFGRTRDGLVPTAFVEQLVREISEIQDSWDARFRTLVEQEDRPEGSFRIGCHPHVAASYVTKSYVSLRSRFPGIELELVLKPSVEVTELVAQGGLDFGIVANPVYHPDLHVAKLATEEACLWANGKLEDGSPVYFNPEMLQIRSILRKLRPYRPVAVQDYALIRELLLEKPGQGAVLPSSSFWGARQVARVTRASKPYYVTEVCLIHRADAPKTRAFREIAQTLKSTKSPT